jgi:alkylated DNA repair dioxygenase AlkB
MTPGQGDDMAGQNGASLLIRRNAPRRIDLGDGAWYEVVEGFVVDPVGTMTELVDTVTWAQRDVLRYDRYIPERRLHAGLRLDAHPLLRQADLHLASRYRVPLDGVAAIWYRDGQDFQGLHADRQMRWLDDTIIAIVVLGVRRPFVFRPRGNDPVPTDRVPAGQGERDVLVWPGHGDLLVMGGTCQRTWLHGVPAADTDQARLSLTWRWTSRRGRPDTAPNYFDGRQFSDRARQPGTRRRTWTGS